MFEWTAELWTYKRHKKTIFYLRIRALRSFGLLTRVISSADDAMNGSRHPHRYRPDCGCFRGAARVCFWLQGDIQSPEIDFRLTPNSGHSEAHAGLPFVTLSGQIEEAPDGPLAYSELIAANALSTIPVHSRELGGSSK